MKSNIGEHFLTFLNIYFTVFCGGEIINNGEERKQGKDKKCCKWKWFDTTEEMLEHEI